MKGFLSLAQLFLFVAVARSVIVVDKPELKPFEEKCVDNIDSLIDRHEIREVAEKPSKPFRLQYDARLNWVVRRDDNVSSIFEPDYTNSSKLEVVAGDRNLTLWEFYFRLYEDKNKPLEIYLVHDVQPIEVFVFPFLESTTPNKGFDALIKALTEFKPEDKLYKIEGFNLVDLISNTEDLSHYRVYERNGTTTQCKSEVKWVVFETKLSVTADQILRFKNEKIVKPTPTRRDTPVVPPHDEKSGKPGKSDNKGRTIGSGANGVQLNYFALFSLVLVALF